MAVYTHFGGMGALVDAVAAEGFRRLSDNLGRVPLTDDPVADIFTKGYAYRQTAIDDPHLYSVTFGLSAPGGIRVNVKDLAGSPTADEGKALEAFGHLVDGARLAIKAGRFRAEEPHVVASQVWSAIHGYVTLEISGHFGSKSQGVGQILEPLGVTLAVGLGDTLQAAERSRQVAADTWLRLEGHAGPGSDDVV
jgi:AcrR family transcriptional regulator